MWLNLDRVRKYSKYTKEGKAILLKKNWLELCLCINLLVITNYIVCPDSPILLEQVALELTRKIHRIVQVLDELLKYGQQSDCTPLGLCAETEPGKCTCGC